MNSLKNIKKKTRDLPCFATGWSIVTLFIYLRLNIYSTPEQYYLGKKTNFFFNMVDIETIIFACVLFVNRVSIYAFCPCIPERRL